MKKWVWGSVIVALGVAAWIGALTRNDVSVRVRDSSLEIYQARIWRWQTNVVGVVAVDYPVRRWIDHYGCLALRKIGIRKYAYRGPSMGWLPGPGYLPQDVLLLFGNYPQKIAGFDLITTNGVNCGLGYGSDLIGFGMSPRRVPVETNFGTANFIETNLHGLFWLRFHGETNVLADVWLR